MSSEAETRALRERVEKLERINAVLLARVEEDSTAHPGPFALFQSNVELQHKVQERTEELRRSLERIHLMNNELVEAAHKADAANEAKTRFLAQAGHDLLQPVTAARLFLSALDETIPRIEDEGDKRRLIFQIGRSLETIEISLRSLLDMSRLDSGVVKPKIQPVWIGALLADLEEDFSTIALQRSLRLDVLPSSLIALSDPIMLARILQNLIGNALKYTTEGRVLVGVRRGKKSLRVDVIDTGPGIAKENFELIFEEFRRIKGAAKNSEGGLGLGLAIVRRLVDALGHTLTIESEPGRGSRFSLQLPLSGCGDAQGRPASQPDHPVDERWTAEGLTAFVIDNDVPVRQAVSDLLRRWNCQPFQYAGSQDAPTAANACPDGPDLLIVDYHLDGETAIEAIDAFRLTFGKPIPALIITADPSDAIAERARQAGVKISYKPVNPHGLKQEIDTVLSSQGTR